MLQGYVPQCYPFWLAWIDGDGNKRVDAVIAWKLTDHAPPEPIIAGPALDLSPGFRGMLCDTRVKADEWLAQGGGEYDPQ